MKFFLILSIIVSRIFPHPANFTAAGASAIFAGATISLKTSIITTFAGLLISDYLLLYVNPFTSRPINISHIYPLSAMFHSTTLFVYTAILVNILIGKLFLTNKSANRLTLVPIFSSLQFFLITNFGVWAMGTYSRGLEGLLESYVMGIPFFKYTLLGDLFYTIVLFKIYEFSLGLSRRFRVHSPVY